MGQFQSDLATIRSKIDDLHPDEPVPTAYVLEMLLILERMAELLDNLQVEFLGKF